MKLKIEHTKYPNGLCYYTVYERQFIFFWTRTDGFFNTLSQAEDYAMQLLKKRKEDLKKDKEAPVYYELKGDRIVYKKGDGTERGIMGEPPLKFKKSEKL
jgi:hypothetical protein